MADVNCVECDGAVPMEGDIVVGEVAQCPHCGVELEVTGVDPITVELAPEVEEDWGE